MREWNGFADGDVYHGTFAMSQGHIALEADLSLEGDIVALRTQILEPLETKHMQVGTSAMLRMMRSLLNTVKAEGYTYLQIEGVRTSGANPQRAIWLRRKA